MNFELREHQSAAITQLREALKQTRRVVMAAPTGAGKTLIATALVENAREKGKRVLFTVPAISLVDQTLEMFAGQGIRDIGVIQANHEMTDWSQPVQIASVQTLLRRCTDRVEGDSGFQREFRADKFPDADLAIVDECHVIFGLYGKWFKDPSWAHKPIIGLSATPWTRGLGEYYDEVVRPVTTRELIEKGLLSPFKVFAPSVHVDMTGVQTRTTMNGGDRDYVEAQSAVRMSQPEIVADVVDTWLKRAERRPTLLFAVNCAHAKLLQERFVAAGVKAGYQDAETSSSERAGIKRAFHNGDLEIVCNVGTLTTGVDWDVRCISLCRPTKSEMLYVQIIGRGLRTANGKDYCLILDHSDSTLRLGFVDEIDVSHDGLHNGASKAEAGVPRTSLPKECNNCGYIKPPRLAICPNCGHEIKLPRAPMVKETSGELTELVARHKKEGPVAGEKSEIFAGLLFIGRERGYKNGWAAYKYKEIYGVWPAHKWVNPKPYPHYDLEAWVKKGQRKWLRERRNGHSLSARQHEILDEVAKQAKQFTPGTLMTPEDWQEDFR